MRPLLIAVLFVATAASAWAEPAPAGQACIAPRADLAPAGFVAQAGCCTGRMQCAQFLSTTTVVRPQREQHT